LRKGHELLLGQDGGLLEVLDISTDTITHTQKIKKVYHICDIVVFDETHFLLASIIGLFKITKE
jgi:hypothetical protein